MKPKRYGSGAATERTPGARKSGNGKPAKQGRFVTRDGSRPRAGSDRSEYLLLSVWDVREASWQPRRVFDQLEGLAATIEGGRDAEALGVLEPILVRRVPDGYEVIDGERRLRACRLIAERRSEREFLIPARVFEVSERVAMLMGQAANLERDTPKPFEIALGYQRIRAAMLEEARGDGATVRAVAGLGRHGRTQVAEYLRIADALTREVLAEAGLVGPAGEPEFDQIARLTQTDLLAVAREPSATGRAAQLRGRVARFTGATPAPSSIVALTETSPEERRTQISTLGGLNLRVREPVQMLDPTVARDLAARELVPALLAIVDRACRGSDQPGFMAQIAEGHAVLVVPTDVESLTLAQLGRLRSELDAIRNRVQRSARFRRGRKTAGHAAVSSS